MIRFHYFDLCETRKIGQVTVPRGTPTCHVYSTESVDELLDWGRKRGFVADWLQDARGFVHYLAWGGLLRHCGEGVVYGDFMRDVATARMKRMGSDQRGRPCCGEKKRGEPERRSSDVGER